MSCIATGACKTILLFPVAYYYSKQMPSCQKFEKESLMPLLFKVNENSGMLTPLYVVIFSDPECSPSETCFSAKNKFVNLK